MAGLRKYKYEVVVEVGGKPQIDGIFDTEPDALERATYLLGLAKYTATRVLKTSDRGAPQTIFEKSYTGGGQATKIATIEEANYCADLTEVYGYESRRTLVRIARSYCDEQCMIPLEIVHDYNMLRSLERERRLLTQIVRRLAALQVRTRSLTAESRAEQLEAMFEGLVENARERGPLEPALSVFDRFGLSRLTEHVSASFTADEFDRVVTFVLAQFLAKHRDWLQKLDALVRLIERAPAPAAVKVLDEAIAETLDGSAPMRALLGPAPDLASALRALVSLARGQLDDTQVGTPTALQLNARIKAPGLPATQAVLLDRVAKSLDSTAALTRLDRRADAEAFRGLFEALREYGGFQGGATMAAAITRRAKTVLSESSDDLPFERAVGSVLAMLPGTADRVGYLLDLLATDLGRQRATLLTGHLGQLFTGVRSIGDFLPENVAYMGATVALSRLRPRLYGGGIPEDLADAFMRKLERIAERGVSDSVELAQTAARRNSRAAQGAAAGRDRSLPASPPAPAAPAESSAPARLSAGRVPLVFVHGGREFPVAGDQPVFTLGKGEGCNVTVRSEERVSDVHAVINRVGDDFLLCDLSETGTYVAFRDQAPFVLKRNSVRLETDGILVLGGDPADRSTVGAERLILFRLVDRARLAPARAAQ